MIGAGGELFKMRHKMRVISGLAEDLAIKELGLFNKPNCRYPSPSGF
jgi:hypothetical protein